MTTSAATFGRLAASTPTRIDATSAARSIFCLLTPPAVSGPLPASAGWAVPRPGEIILLDGGYTQG